MAEASDMSTLPESSEPHGIKLETVTVVVDELRWLLLDSLLLLQSLCP